MSALKKLKDKTMKYGLSFILLGLFSGSLESFLYASPTNTVGGPQKLTVPVVSEGPVLNGDMSSPIWQKAAKAVNFVSIKDFSGASGQTEAYVLCDPENLYVAFVCQEPEIDKLVSSYSGKGGDVWNDDCVELGLDPANSKCLMYHWIVNSVGGIWEGMHAVRGTAPDFASGIEVKTKIEKEKKQWICELKIPFKNLGASPPAAGEVWGINFCRERKVGAREDSSWSPARGFALPDQLGQAVFEPAAAPVRLQVTSRGGGAPYFNYDRLNVFSVDVQNTGDKPANVELVVESMEGSAITIGAGKSAVGPGLSEKISAPYRVPNEIVGGPEFSVTVNGVKVYRSSIKAHAVVESAAGPREWVVDDPLFKKLLGSKPMGLDRVALIWTHAIAGPYAKLLRDTAKCFGVRYVLEELYRDYGKYGLIPVGASSLNAEYIKKYDVKTMCYQSFQPKDVPWVLDPRSFDHQIKQNSNALEQASLWNTWGVFAGDEVLYGAMSEGINLKANPPGGYDYIRKADEEVKSLYGGGKWGIPGNQRKWEPYNWIAYHKWMIDKFCGQYARLQAMVKAKNPGLVMVSFDSHGGTSFGYEFSRLAKYFDVFTFQWTPGKKRWQTHLGFLTKAHADVTGKDVWPCTHVENYSMAPTPEEVVEELSQVFRNGGTGFHFYLPDVANSKYPVGDTRNTFFGSPRRYHTILNIVDLARKMPGLKFPEYERTAVLFNDDCLQCQLNIDGFFLTRTETCYTFLGPVARSWFKFIDCAQVLELPLNEKFDVIYLPVAGVQRKEIVDKLRKFVENGGTLVCADPQAFSGDTLGNDTVKSRQEIFGVKTGERLQVEKLVMTLGKNKRELFAGLSVRYGKKEWKLPISGGGWKLELDKNVETLAKFEDGSPAIVSRKMGKGRAIFFAFFPFVKLEMVENPEWRAFFKEWVHSLGPPTDLDIWRFRFPDSVIWKQPPRRGLCLTGNNVVWQEEKPSFPQNTNFNGTYSYSILPDLMPDEKGDDGKIPFGSGHLTDRRTSINAEKIKPEDSSSYKLPVERWMAGWSNANPVSVTFDLQKDWKPLALRLWFTEVMPPFTVEGGADGKDWQPFGKHEGQNAGEDVYDLEVALSGNTTCRYIRVNFAERKKKERLALVETEIWGNSAGGREH